MEKQIRNGWNHLRILGVSYLGVSGIMLLVGVILLLTLPREEAWIAVASTAPVLSIFFLLGLGFLIADYRKKRKLQAILSAGRFVWAEVVDCVYNYKVSYHNGIHPYRIVACYTAPGGVKHIFRSQDCRIYDPRAMVGKPVKVYHDEDFKHYYVDAQPLLGEYVEH